LLTRIALNVLQVAAASFLETSMAFDKTALGNRYTCYECEVKFYDLNKDPICPSCKADQMENPNPDARETFLASLSTRGRRKAKKEEVVEEVIEEVVDEVAKEGDEDDEEDEEMNAALESELGEADLTMGGEDDEEEEEEV
jgi:hypothetical protein